MTHGEAADVLETIIQRVVQPRMDQLEAEVAALRAENASFARAVGLTTGELDAATRREHVRALRNRGATIAVMSRVLRVATSTIERDIATLGVPPRRRTAAGLAPAVAAASAAASVPAA